jgi:hypothetical protein
VRHIIALAVPANRVNLVFHQRNKRRNDNGCSFHHQGRQLVTQRFSAAGWHDHKCVFAIQYTADDFFLIALEFVKPEEPL